MTDFERGYEQGKLAVVSNLYFELNDLEGSRKVLEKIRNWMWKNYEEYVPVFGYDEPTKYEMKFCYLKTVEYRDEKIDVFDDDAGQQFYFYYKNKSYSCGAYNFDYESYIYHVVDHDKDDICNFGLRDSRFFGAYCRYANWEHTKVEFSFRGEVLEIFDVDENDPLSVVKIWQECEKRLQKLFEDPEFIKAEEERKSKGDLYFNELID